MAQDKTEFRVDGQHYTLDDLTFAELREHRKLVRQFAEDPTIEVVDASMIDFYPPFIYIIKRRTDPEYTLDDAQAGKIEDYFFAPKRPTRRPPKPNATS